MERIKEYYGGAFFNDDDLKESKVSRKIELEYYTTKTHSNMLREETRNVWNRNNKKRI